MLTALKFPTRTKWPARPLRRARDVLRKPYGKDLALGWGAKSALMVALVTFCFFYGAIYAIGTPFLIVPLLIPSAILAMVVIWALPDLHVAPMRTLEFLFFGFLFVMIAWPNYLAVALPGMPWITVQRLIDFPMAAIFLVCLSTSRSFRVSLATSLKSAPWLARAIYALIAIQVISVAFAGGDFAFSMAQLFNSLSNWMLIFFCGCYVFQKDGRVNRFIYMTMGLIAFIGLIALWEKHLDHLPWAGHIPSFLKIQDPAVQAIVSGTRRSGVYRAQATFTTSLSFSEYLALMAPFLLHVIFERYPRNVKITALCILPLLVRAATLSQARTGMVGMLMACLLYPSAWIFLEWRRNPSRLVTTCAVALSPLFILLGLGASFVIPGLKHRLWISGASEYSNQARIDQWHMGIPKILSHPWGYGIGRGAEVLGYTSPGGGLTIDSYPLRLLLEYGVLGTVIYYGVLIAGIYYAADSAYRSHEEDSEARFMLPIVVALACFILMKSVLAQEENHSIVFAFLAMSAALRMRLTARKANIKAPQIEPKRPAA